MLYHFQDLSFVPCPLCSETFTTYLVQLCGVNIIYNSNAFVLSFGVGLPKSTN